MKDYWPNIEGVEEVVLEKAHFPTAFCHPSVGEKVAEFCKRRFETVNGSLLFNWPDGYRRYAAFCPIIQDDRLPKGKIFYMVLKATSDIEDSVKKIISYEKAGQ